MNGVPPTSSLDWGFFITMSPVWTWILVIPPATRFAFSHFSRGYAETFSVSTREWDSPDYPADPK
jgi:hypothetical protein